MPANRTRMWLARGAIAFLVVLFLVLKIFGIPAATSVRDGDATVYTTPPVGPIISGVLAIITGVAAIVFWMQTGHFYRLVSVALGATAIYTLLNAPTGWNHRVIVTSDYFYHKVGSWYSPVETKVNFDSLAYATVEEAKANGRGPRTYELRCFTRRGGDPIRIPIYDMMKKALPEILNKAAQHGVVIGENADGLQIPSDLRE